jgi:hypothetical protein
LQLSHFFAVCHYHSSFDPRWYAMSLYVLRCTPPPTTSSSLPSSACIW